MVCEIKKAKKQLKPNDYPTAVEPTSTAVVLAWKVPGTTAMRVPNMYWPVQKNRSIQRQSCACSAGMKESYLHNLKRCRK